MRLSSIRNVCTENIKNNRHSIIVHTVLLIFMLPVMLLLYSIRNSGSLSDIAEGLINELYPTFAMTYSFITAVSVFSYLHKKRSMDFYGSMPVSRREEFFGRLLAVWLSMVLPMTAVALFSCVINPTAETSFIIIFGTARLIVAMTASISMVAFIAICCGTVGSTVVTYLLINGIYPIFCLIVLNLPKMIPGFAINLNNIVITSMLSPYLAPYIMAQATFEQTLAMVIVFLVISAVMLVASYLLINKRKAECAQTSTAYVAPGVIIRFMSTFTVGFIGAVMFCAVFQLTYMITNTTNSDNQELSSIGALVIFLIGYVLVSFVAHLILHLIYNRGLSGFAKSFILYGAQLGFCLIIMGIITTGAFGYVDRIPEVDDIKSIEVSVPYHNFTYKGNDLSKIKYNDKETIAQTREVHKKIVDEIDKKCNKLYISFFENLFNDNYDYQIKYNLKDGSTLKRIYNNVKLADLGIFTRDIFDYDKIEENVFLQLPSEEFDSVELDMDDNEEYYYYIDWENKQDMTNLIDAIKADYKRLGEFPTAQGKIMVTFGVKNADGIGEYIDIDINEDFTETMKLIKSKDYQKYKDVYDYE
ncbi:MAG: hypothetical protein IJV39_06625 [Ruminococcus sp.]|nr:hypothetical protein [Ruminococcus sp.]